MVFCMGLDYVPLSIVSLAYFEYSLNNSVDNQFELVVDWS